MTSEPATPNIDLAFAAGKEEGKFEARAAAERDVAALREAVESELARLVGLADRYAGPGPGSVGSLVDLQNVYGSFEVLRRILDNPAAAEPCPGCGTLDGQHAVSCHGVDESEPPAARLAELLASRVEEAQRTVREEWPEWLRRNRDAVHVPIKPAEPRWPSGPDAERELAAALHAANVDCDYSRKFDRKSCQAGDGPHSIMARALIAALGGRSDRRHR